MPASKFINLLAVSTLAILACSYGPTNVQALGAESHGNVARHIARGHDGVAKRKRGVSKRCKTRSTSLSSTSAAPPSTSKAASSTSTKAASSSKAPEPSSTYVAPKETATAKPAVKAVKPETTSTTPKETSTKAAAPTSTPKASGGNTAATVWGAGYPDGPYKGTLKNHWANTQVSWYFNWRSEGDSTVNFGNHDWITPAPNTMEYVPQLWGADSDRVNKFWKDSANFKAEGVTHILGFNEPDQAAQSNIQSGYDGAGKWDATVGQLAGQYRLVSPCLTSDPKNLQWYKDFMKTANVKPDVICLHWYGTKVEEFKTYAKLFHDTFNMPIWVTEIACTDFAGSSTCPSVSGFMHEVAVFASQNSWLERLAWYGMMDLTKSNGFGAVDAANGLCAGQQCPNGRSALGNQYANGLW